MIAHLKNFILDSLFPPLCLTCKKLLAPDEKKNVVCAACVASVPLYDAMFCPICLRRIPHGNDHCHPQAKYVLAPAAHYGHETVKKLIWQFKYENWLSAGAPLTHLMTSYLKNLPHTFTGYEVVPMPLHASREWQRGFNQATMLAAAIGTAFTLPIAANNLVRARETAIQADQKDYAAREKNVQGAFHVLHPEEFAGKNIILVDDVTTSGATLNEAVKALKACGAKRIVAAVVARAR